MTVVTATAVIAAALAWDDARMDYGIACATGVADIAAECRWLDSVDRLDNAIAAHRAATTAQQRAAKLTPRHDPATIHAICTEWARYKRNTPTTPPYGKLVRALDKLLEEHMQA